MVKALDGDAGDLGSIFVSATDSLCDLGKSLWASLFPSVKRMITLLACLQSVDRRNPPYY